MITLLLASLLTTAIPYTVDHPTAQTGPQHILLGQPININTADAVTLEALPGIGPALALRIVADREKRGSFQSVEGLDRVKGVGPKILQNVKNMTIVTPDFAK